VTPVTAGAPSASASALAPSALAPSTAPGGDSAAGAPAQGSLEGQDTGASDTGAGSAAAGTGSEIAGSPDAASTDAASTAASSPDAALPPSDSLVAARPTDLFDRLRSGFMLQDVDEPAIDSQVNWFANHPDFLDRTWDRASPWLYYIVGQLEQRNMPRELALLPVIESAFNTYAYSRARAAGLWQFVSDTGRRFNLKQDWWYDGRRDPIEATKAALDYLQALHNEFNGDWLLAIAAYNCGELEVSRAIQRNERRGLPTDFWHLRLPAETRSYVPELLAMRRLVANPSTYGLEISPIDDVPYFTEVDTGGPVALKVVAEIAHISVEDLYDLNPGFQRWATDPTGPFRILVPTDVAEGLQQTLAQLTPDERMDVAHYTVQRRDTLSSIARRFRTTPQVIRELNELTSNERPVIDADLRVPSQNIQLPEKVEHAALLASLPARRFRRRHGRPQIHIVRRGDTLYSLARRMHTNVDALAALNGMTPDEQLRAGQRLRLSARAAAPHLRPLGTDSTALGASAHPSRNRHSVLAGAGAPSGGAGAAADGSRRLSYVVRRGDTLYGIARLLQVTVNDLLSWNALRGHGRDLRPGQVLVAFVKSRS
jgi:peptidoglycan lytic transglycosylase D